MSSVTAPPAGLDQHQVARPQLATACSFEGGLAVSSTAPTTSALPIAPPMQSPMQMPVQGGGMGGVMTLVMLYEREEEPRAGGVVQQALGAIENALLDGERVGVRCSAQT